MSNKALALIGMMWTLGAGVFAQVDFWTFCKNGTAGDISAALVYNAKVEDRNARGMTPLMIAAEFNPNEGVVAALLGAGADGAKKDRGGKSAYDYARGNRTGLPGTLLEALRRAERK